MKEVATMKLVGLLLLALLPVVCRADVSPEFLAETEQEVTDGEQFDEDTPKSDKGIKMFFAGRIGKDGRPKKLNMAKVKELAKKKALAKEIMTSMTTPDANGTLPNVPAVIIEPDTTLARLWYPPPSTKQDWREFFHAESERGKKNGVRNELPSPETQYVYLDFDPYATYSVNIVNMEGEKIGEFGPFHGYQYREFEQELIVDRLRRDYHLYNVEFVTRKPKKEYGPYTTIKFNANDFPTGENAISTLVFPATGEVRLFSVLFGLAEGIDYLNLIRDDYVRVNGNVWSFLVELDPTGALFELYTGITLPVINRRQALMAALSRVTINQSANTASHELGHALGLRHHDAFGAPGDGLPVTGRPESIAYYQPYPGPILANETILHLMASSAVVGIEAMSYTDHARTDRFFSERSSIKLTLAEGCGNFMTEKEAKQYGSVLKGMEIPEFYVQNPIEEGENKGGRYLRIDTINIAGHFDYHDEVDGYRLYLKEDRIFTAEVISFSSTLKYRVMTTLTLFKVSKNGHRRVVANNDFPFESFDPMILDFKVPETGTYVLAVAVQQHIPIDRDQDAEIDDLYSVKHLGGEDFLHGEYNLLIYNHHEEIQKYKYRDDHKFCFPTKKVYHSPSYESHDDPHPKPYSSSSDNEHSKEPSKEYSKEGYSDYTEYEHSKESYSDSPEYGDETYSYDSHEYDEEKSSGDYQKDHLRGSSSSGTGGDGDAEKWDAP